MNYPNVTKSLITLVMSFLFMIVFNNLANSQALPQTYTSSGTWTCPAGVTVVQVETWGGGGSGGGASANQQAGGGGGGGGYNQAFVSVIPGNIYTITVGQGGVASVTFGLGTGGGSSDFNGLVIATGGAPGQPNTAGGTGGAGGTGMFSGGLGATGINGGGPGVGGGGGGGAGTSGNGLAGTAPTGGAGGTGNAGAIGGNGGINTGSNGSPGNIIGAGGGGGFRAPSVSRLGGNGARGEVRLTTAPPIAPTYTSCPSNIVIGTSPGICTGTTTYTTTTFGNPLPTESYVFSGATSGSGSGTGSGSIFNAGITTVTITATNGTSPDATCVFTVTVNDNEAPVLTSPGNQILGTAAGVCNQTFTIADPISDNCLGSTWGYTLSGATTLGPITGIADGSGSGPLTFNTGVTTVTLSGTDGTNNAAGVSFTVTVNDTQAPVITCPSNLSVSNDAGLCSAVVSYVAPIGTDNCPGANTVQTAGLISGSTFPVGVTTNTFVVTDATGNSTACSFTVTVNDNEDPILTCNSIIVNPSPGNPVTVLPGMVTTSAADNCALFDTTVTPNVFDCTMNGNTIPVTVEIFDVNGNSFQCFTTVQVIGIGCPTNQPPVAVCVPGGITVSANGSCLYPANAEEFDGGSSDPDSDPMSFSISPSGPFGLGTTNVTLTVDDGNGGSSTCTTTITVNDNTAPVPDNLVNAPLTFNAGPFSLDPFGPNFYDVNVTGLPATITPGMFVSACLDITYPTVEDLDVYLVDPGVTAFVQLIPASSGMSGSDLIATCFDQVSTDNPSVGFSAPYTGMFDDEWAVPGGLATFNGADPNNSPAAWQFIIVNNGGSSGTVNNLSLTFIGSSTGLADINGTCSVTINTAETATDNCSGAINGTASIGGVAQVIPFTITTEGTTVIDWTFTDLAGNTTTAQQNVIISDDNTAPVPDVASLPNATGECSVTPTAPTATDNCAGTVTGTTGTVFPITTQGTTVVTWTYNDGNGNSTTQTQNVIVNDVTAPTIVCPVNITTNSDAGLCSASGISLGTPTVNDNCGVASITNDAPAIFPVGTTIVTWTVTDIAIPGNTATCTQSVTVVDNQVPSITCPANMSIDCSADNTPTGTGTATASDNCGATSVTFSDAVTAGSCAGNYTITRTWTATDASLNTSTCVQTITVTDITAPVLSGVPANTAADCSSVPAAASPTATDDCSGATVTFNETIAAGSCAGNYTITRTWTATDGCGNSSTGIQTITVTDITAPVLSGVPANTTADCSSVPAAASPTATDDCSGATVTFNETIAAGSCAGNYTITRTWTATDGCGNSSTGIQTITVTDVTAPVLSGVPANTTVDCSSVPASASPTATDDCSGATVTFNETIAAGSCAGNYTITRTWTATDGCGNSSTGIQTITVTDITAPVLSGVPANTTADCSSVPAAASPTATDDCSGATVTFNETIAAGSCAGNYTITRTWTATDGCGNSSTGTQVITVQDVTAPVLSSPPADTTVSCTSIPPAATLTATDDCSGATITFNETITPGACGSNNTITRTWTATDGCGNSSTATQIITVEDLSGPSITCASDVIVNVSCAPATVILTPPTVTDPCSGVVSVVNNHPGTTYSLGQTAVTWTATDNCGNTSTCIQMVIVTSPEAHMMGNGWAINHGSTIISLTNGTDFGNVNVSSGTVTRTYVLKNTGSGTLNLTGVPKVQITGLHAPDFTVIQPLVNSLAPGASTSYQIIFNPSASGYRHARVNLLNDDCNESGYWFSIRGYGEGSASMVPDPSGQTQTSGNENQEENNSSETTSVNEITTLNGVLYPNPSDGIFTLELSEMPTADTEIELLNSLGQVIYSGLLMAQTSYYDFSYLKAGTYYLQLTNPKIGFTKKIIITQKY